MTKQNIPNLRFKMFNEGWEKVKLNKILAERNELSAETEEYRLMSFVQGEGVVPKGERYDRSFLVKSSDKKYKKTELGDFIYSSNNLETGSIGFNKQGKAVISPVYSIFSSQDSLASRFIGVASSRREFINEMIRFRQGVVYGQWRIHETDFLNIQLDLPNNVEQQKILALFQTLDELLSAYKDNLANYQAFKATMLSKMFPKAGQTIPEIRLEGFDGEWEEKKLGELVDEFSEIVSGKTGLPIATSSRKGLFLQDEYFNGQRTGINNSLDFHRVPIGYITYRHMSDDSIFRFNINNFSTDILVSKEYPVFTNNVYSDLNFILYHLNHTSSFAKFSAIQKLGGTRVRLYYKNLVTYKLRIPKIEEQQAIASFFSNLDDLISTYQEKIDQLGTLKKRLLQEMFI